MFIFYNNDYTTLNNISVVSNASYSTNLQVTRLQIDSTKSLLYLVDSNGSWWKISCNQM